MRAAHDVAAEAADTEVIMVADVERRASTVTLRAPYRRDRKLLDVTFNVVQVREHTPPKDDVSID